MWTIVTDGNHLVKFHSSAILHFPFTKNTGKRYNNAMYLYLTTRSEPERHLIEAECIAIIGSVPDHRGIVLTEAEADVSRAAYIKTCMKMITRVSDLPEL
ncbi:hypothetical protein ACFL6S_31400, partial [Candidatus Poribacteria bacterium]